MKTIQLCTLLFSLVAVALPSQASSFSEPIARAAKGQLQCYSPNPSRKTCKALAAFRTDAHGKVVTTAVILVSPNPPIIMNGSASVTTRSGELCGILTARNIQDATFSNGVDALDPMQSGLMRSLVAALLGNVLDHETCATYTAEGGTFRVRPIMDGAPISAPDQRMMWVSPAEGYRVGD